MWTETSVAGHPCEIFEPRQPHPQGYVALYLHGVHQNRLREHSAFVEQFEKHGLRVVCPQTKRSWWTDKICLEFDLKVTAERYVVDHILQFIHDRWQIKPPQIGLFGMSMGGQGALRFGFKHPNKFPVVAAISPAIDYHQCMRYPEEENDPLFEMYSDPESARQDTATLHVHPLNWPRNLWFCCDPTDLRWYDGADRLRMKLSALGIPFQVDLETTDGGHGFQYYNRMAATAIGFLFDALERERLRVF